MSRGPGTANAVLAGWKTHPQVWFLFGFKLKETKMLRHCVALRRAPSISHDSRHGETSKIGTTELSTVHYRDMREHTGIPYAIRNT
jgi:hypothetical protein